MPDIPEILQTVQGENVLAINPPVHDFAYFDLWARPLGLLYVLEYLRTRGNNVTLIDCIAEAPEKYLSFGRMRPMRSSEPKPAVYRNIPRRYWRFGLSREDLDRRLRAVTEPDLILVTSMMTYWYTGAWETIRQVKRIYPDVPLILGGVYARLCPGHAAGSEADYVIDRPFPLPARRPALDLYARPGYAVSLTSTGCPMNCDYCASSALWPCFRQRPVEETLEEIAFQISPGGIHDVAFYDDALLIRCASHFTPLCKQLGERFKNLRYHTPNGLHVREISPEVANIMATLDFSTIRLSLESIDSEVVRS
ncbi:MAG: cobalamin-dependent protein, partial [Synergistota bacterium]|nr:cobalamin-dependent protein [Synergistota bacterium]